MAIGAASEACARRLWPARRIDCQLLGRIAGEKDLLLQVFSIEGAFAEQPHLRRDEFFRVGLRRQARAACEVRVLCRQAAQVGAHACRFAVWDVQLRIVGIELERVAALAVSVEAEGLKVRVRRIGLMAVGAGQFPARKLHEAGEMERVIEV